ncbi:MAG: hypothetical protein ACOH2T_29275 [Pseudomonas sp.]
MTNHATTFGFSREQKPAPGSSKAANGQKAVANGTVLNPSRHVALELEKLAVRVQSAGTFNASVQARLQFIISVIEHGATRSLNELGRLLPFAWLSERMLDRVFEDGDISDEVARLLVARAEADGSFARAVAIELGPGAVSMWKQSTRQGSLL